MQKQEFPRQEEISRSSNTIFSAADRTVTLTRCPHTTFKTVDTNYLSLSIDISVLAGGSWWEGSKGVSKGLGTNKVAPLDLYQEELRRLSDALAPFYLRLGGSEADTIHYFEPAQNNTKGLTLSVDQWDAVHDFVDALSLKLYFTAKYGVFDRKGHGCWQGEELEKLLMYAKEQGQQLDVVELGNELNAYWIFHGITAQPGPKNLAADYVTFSSLVKHYFPDARIAGPGSAFWPKIGEPIAPFSNLTRSFLEQIPQSIDIIDWHYYPFQSKRSPVRTRTATERAMLNPKSFNDFDRYCRMLVAWRDEYHPEAQVWTGESGSAQCGGQVGVSDRWASSFWWADQLGLGAKLGQSVMIRQSLVGGEYGLIDRETLSPRADYWVSLLWQQLMGQYVHPVQSPSPHVRAYCHANDSDQKTLLLINLSDNTLDIQCDAFGDIATQYTLTADSLDNQEIEINGISANNLLNDLNIHALPQAPRTHRLAPRSIAFWTLCH